MQLPASVGHSLAGGEESPPGTTALLPVSVAVTAFVGRTLKGPVNEPVCVNSYAQFAQVFGGLWSAAPLAQSVEQYFQHGGELAVVVRVANGGRAPTIDLPAGKQTLVLMGICPGSREFLRASVDYEGLDPANEGQFNLTVQRLRTAGSELVEQQEVFRRLSILPGSERDARSVLMGSRLVRVQGHLPALRPQATRTATAQLASTYIDCNADGSDGLPLNDYDLIGSQTEGSGLFALEAGPAFNFLCIPDLTPEQSVGMSTLMVAARLCRAHHALLLVEPPLSWQDTEAALAGLVAWPFHSPEAVMFYPRVRVCERAGEHGRVLGSAGVAAGLMARAARQEGRWWQESAVELALADVAQPAASVTAAQRKALALAGVNPLLAKRSGDTADLSLCTLAGPASQEHPSLMARRLELWLTATIERGTRWAHPRRADPKAWEQLQQQVSELLEQSQSAGALPLPDADFFVICDQRLNKPHTYAGQTLRLLYGVAARGTGQSWAWLLEQGLAGSTTRRVSVSRLATCGPQVAAEIEADLLRNLSR